MVAIVEAVSFRRDGSSAFSYTGNEWQNFFSLGGGWLMSEEDVNT